MALLEWIRARSHPFEDDQALVREVAARLRTELQWRPIETAPKHERIELWDRYPFFSHISEAGECWDCGALMDPTHWRPASEGPK